MNSSLTKTYTAAGTIAEFAAVKLDAANKIVVTGNSANSSCVGIAQTSAVSGDEVNVVVFGRTQMIAGATITPASTGPLMATTDGKMAAATSGRFPVATVEGDAAVLAYSAGEVFTGIFTPPRTAKA